MTYINLIGAAERQPDTVYADRVVATQIHQAFACQTEIHIILGMDFDEIERGTALQEFADMRRSQTETDLRTTCVIQIVQHGRPVRKNYIAFIDAPWIFEHVPAGT